MVRQAYHPERSRGIVAQNVEYHGLPALEDTARPALSIVEGMAVPHTNHDLPFTGNGGNCAEKGYCQPI